jgi:hypothetical protein
MGKKVLLVDFGGLSGKKDHADADADLRGLFREAHMNNALLFFDECETVFRSRNQVYFEVAVHSGKCWF